MDERPQTAQQPAKKATAQSLAGQTTNEHKLGMMYEFIHKYIHGLFKAGRFEKETFTFPKA
jgi:hypothetical protein